MSDATYLRVWLTVSVAALGAMHAMCGALAEAREAWIEAHPLRAGEDS